MWGKAVLLEGGFAPHKSLQKTLEALTIYKLQVAVTKKNQSQTSKFAQALLAWHHLLVVIVIFLFFTQQHADVLFLRSLFLYDERL